MKKLAISLSLASVLLALSACQDPTAPPEIELLLQVRAERAPTAPPATAPTRAPGIESIELQEVVVVLGGLRLLAAENSSLGDWTLDASVVVPLRLGGEATVAFSTAVPQGRYRQLDTFVDELETADPADAALINVFPRLSDTSVLVRGVLTRDGAEEPFLFKSAVHVDVELPFSRPESFSSQANIVKLYTLTFDLDQWFMSAPGEPLDPNDEADRATIEETLAGSVELFKGA